MINFMAIWLRGIVMTVAFVILATILFGLLVFTINFPNIGLPLLVLVILPLYFGWTTEDDS